MTSSSIDTPDWAERTLSIMKEPREATSETPWPSHGFKALLIYGEKLALDERLRTTSQNRLTAFSSQSGKEESAEFSATLMVCNQSPKNQMTKTWRPCWMN